jgi:hypothetical protein
MATGVTGPIDVYMGAPMLKLLLVRNRTTGVAAGVSRITDIQVVHAAC